MSLCMKCPDCGEEMGVAFGQMLKQYRAQGMKGKGPSFRYWICPNSKVKRGNVITDLLITCGRVK